MAQLINTPQTPSSRYTVTLGGETYQLAQRWNGRSKAWYLDIATSDGVVIRTGGKMLPKVPLVLRNKELIPKGNLFVVRNLEGYKLDVGRNNLGLESPYTLAYLTSEEIENA